MASTLMFTTKPFASAIAPLGGRAQTKGAHADEINNARRYLNQEHVPTLADTGVRTELRTQAFLLAQIEEEA